MIQPWWKQLYNINGPGTLAVCTICQNPFQYDASNLARHAVKCKAQIESTMTVHESTERLIRFVLRTHTTCACVDDPDFMWRGPLISQTTLRTRIADAFECYVEDHVANNHFPVITFDGWHSRKHRAFVSVVGWLPSCATGPKTWRLLGLLPEMGGKAELIQKTLSDFMTNNNVTTDLLLTDGASASQKAARNLSVVKLRV